MGYLLAQGDAVRIALPDRSVSLVLGSPPYLSQRSYLEGGRNLGIARDFNHWVSWMLTVTAEALRVSQGAVIWIAAGCTKDRNYQPACEALMARWFAGDLGSGFYHDGIEIPRAIGSMYRPCYWHRVGIPGSGGDQWFRADVEYAMCFKRPGPLPWADNTACGHPPKWAPGGEMSHRLSDGTRTNQWGKTGTDTGTRQLAGGVVRHGEARPSHETMTRKERGERRKALVEAGCGRVIYGEGVQFEPGSNQAYLPPTKANPGNLIRVEVGGGLMGNRLCHENEAPYPEEIAEFFIRSLCQSGGIVLDPFSGSGTTAAVATRLGRHGLGFDLRRSQCELGARRIAAGLRPVSRLDPPPARASLKGQMNLFVS